MDTRLIVLIDDDVDDLDMFKDVLLSLKVEQEILTFNDSIKALDFFTNTQKVPFLILCEINMPRLNGLDLRGKLCEVKFLRDKTIPFLFLSTGDAMPEIKMAYELSIQGYFEKPDTLEGTEELFARIINYWTSSQHPHPIKNPDYC